MTFKYDPKDSACRAAHKAGEKTILDMMSDGKKWSPSYIAMAVVQDALHALQWAQEEEVAPRQPLGTGWKLVADGGVPCGATLETYRAGERGTNLSCVIIRHLGEEPEWIDVLTGVTTVTHLTYLAPTHWRWPQAARFCNYCDREYGELHTDDCTRVKLDYFT